jgi:dienelactone hydrolase
VLYYPATSWIPDINALVGRINVPVLLLAAEKDSYRNCCPIERARQIEQAAKGRGLAFEMVVYPQADHAFDLPGPQHRAADTDDAWQRTSAMLARLHPVKP